MKERPIIFNAQMVRAILDGSKTQTRVVVKFPKNWVGKTLRPFCKVGDRLWVRETWAQICHSEDGQCYGDECLECVFEYRADKPEAKWAGDWDNDFPGIEVPDGCKWRPSIFMPRAASRITLEITDVRVERLMDISEQDAIAEGFPPRNEYGEPSADGQFFKPNPESKNMYTSARNSFKLFWRSIFGDESWYSNPYVWVITFKKI